MASTVSFIWINCFYKRKNILNKNKNMNSNLDFPRKDSKSSILLMLGADLLPNELLPFNELLVDEVTSGLWLRAFDVDSDHGFPSASVII